MRINKSVLTMALMGLLTVSASSIASETQWQKNHPRRDEVNHRLDKQQQRIKHDVKDGSMSHDEAKSLHAQDKSIREQERADATAHNGHITSHEKTLLNQEENNVNQQIKTH